MHDTTPAPEQAPASSPRARLDSWKAIADYISRDVRTARRWEAQGLPVHRVPGRTRKAVFAYADEIDAWLAGEAAAGAAAVSPAPDAVPRTRLGRAAAATLLATGAVLAIGLLRWPAGTASLVPARIAITPAGVEALDHDGARRWMHAVPAGWRADVGRGEGDLVDFDRDGHPEILAGLVSLNRGLDQGYRGGELWSFLPDGQVRWSFSLDASVRFAAREYTGPWMLAEWRAEPAGSRVAAAFHHQQWWPSVLVMLDAGGRPLGRFVNAGWIEMIRWLPSVSAPRLALAGISNAQDAGMVALLDPARPDGQSPEDDAGYRCANCPAGRPLWYAVFPRSELNRVTGAPFNRASLELVDGAFTVRTQETAGNPGAVVPPAEALYDFGPTFDLRAARYSERYWDLHRQLEQEGRIAHGRAQCPERDGPREMRVWTPAGGWQIVRPRPVLPAA